MTASISLTASRRFLDSIFAVDGSSVPEGNKQWEWWWSPSLEGAMSWAIYEARDRVTCCFVDSKGDIEVVPADLCTIATGYFEAAFRLLSASPTDSGLDCNHTLETWPSQMLRYLQLDGTERKALRRTIIEVVTKNPTHECLTNLGDYAPFLESGTRDALTADALDVMAETAYQLTEEEAEERPGLLESLLTTGIASMIAAKALGVPDEDMQAAHIVLGQVREASKAVDNWIRTVGLMENEPVGDVSKSIEALERLKF